MELGGATQFYKGPKPVGFSAFTNETGIPGETRTVAALSCYYSTESCIPDEESENKLFVCYINIYTSVSFNVLFFFHSNTYVQYVYEISLNI